MTSVDFANFLIYTSTLFPNPLSLGFGGTDKGPKKIFSGLASQRSVGLLGLV